MNNNYWEKEYTDIFEGITFKFKQLRPDEHLNLAIRNAKSDNPVVFNTDEGYYAGDDLQYLISRSLEAVVYAKTGNSTFMPLIANNTVTCTDVMGNNGVLLDLFWQFKKDVLVPVFTGSKTFRHMLVEQGTATKTVE